MGHKWRALRPPEPKWQEHLAKVVQLFLNVIQGRGKLHPFGKRGNKTVVRANKKSFTILTYFRVPLKVDEMLSN